jgi:hypothetical protein
VNAGTATINFAKAAHTGDLTFVGFATWLDESIAIDGHIELWQDNAGRMFAWTVNGSGESSVRIVG